MEASTENNNVFPDILPDTIPSKSTSISYSMNSFDDFLDETSFHDRILMINTNNNNNNNNIDEEEQTSHSSPSPSQKRFKLFNSTTNISRKFYENTPLWLKLVILLSSFALIFALGIAVSGTMLINEKKSQHQYQQQVEQNNMLTSSSNENENDLEAVAYNNNNEIIVPSISPSILPSISPSQLSLKELKAELHGMIHNTDKNDKIITTQEEESPSSHFEYTFETIDPKIIKENNENGDDGEVIDMTTQNEFTLSSEKVINTNVPEEIPQQKKKENNNDTDVIKQDDFFYLYDNNNTDAPSLPLNNNDNDGSVSSLAPTNTPTNFTNLIDPDVGGGMHGMKTEAITTPYSSSNNTIITTEITSPSLQPTTSPTNILISATPSQITPAPTTNSPSSTPSSLPTATASDVSSSPPIIPPHIIKNYNNDDKVEPKNLGSFLVTGGNLSINQLQTISTNDNDNTSNTKFLIHLGNFIQGTDCKEREYQLYSKSLQINMNIPVFIIPGINDWYNCITNTPSKSYTYWLNYFKQFEQYWLSSSSNTNINTIQPTNIGYSQHSFTFTYDDNILFIGIKLLQEDNTMEYYYSIKTFDYIKSLMNKAKSIIILGDIPYDGAVTKQHDGCFTFFHLFNIECSDDSNDITCYYIYEFDDNDSDVSSVRSVTTLADSIVTIGVQGASLPAVQVQMYQDGSIFI